MDKRQAPQSSSSLCTCGGVGELALSGRSFQCSCCFGRRKSVEQQRRTFDFEILTTNPLFLVAPPVKFFVNSPCASHECGRAVKATVLEQLS